MRWHLMREIEERGAEAVVDDAISEALDGPDAIYLSVDIDVLDPGMAPGTGYAGAGRPANAGVAARHTAHRRPSRARRHRRRRGVPPYDTAEITAMAAHRCVLEAISALAVKNVAQKVASGPPIPSSCRRRRRRPALPGAGGVTKSVPGMLGSPVELGYANGLTSPAVAAGRGQFQATPRPRPSSGHGTE